MTPTIRCCFFCCVWLGCAIFGPVSSAAPPPEASAEQPVEIRAWIGSPDAARTTPYAVHEQVIFYIDIATPRWFSGGTNIGTIDVPDLIAKQRNSLATNYTERRGAETWSRQRWEITLYPQASGQFTIPPIPVHVQVADGQGQTVRGTLSTPARSFEASIPSGKLKAGEPWFTATRVSLTQQWQTSSETLQVGDAITRTVHLEADNTLSILIPPLLDTGAASQYQAYPQPSALADASTRGNYVSTRTDEVVYILQTGGDIRLPAHTLKWWNSQTQQLEVLSVAGQTYSVHHTPASFVRAYAHPLGWGLAGLAGLAGLYLGFKRFAHHRKMPLFIQLLRTVAQGDFAKARLLTYIQLKRCAQIDAFSKRQTLQSYGEQLPEARSLASFITIWRGIQKQKAGRPDWRKPLQLEQTLKDKINRGT